jgi:protein O-mannosyl-transferase
MHSTADTIQSTRSGLSALLANRVFHVLLIVVIGLLAYSSSFHGAFVFDDEPQIVNNVVIRDLANFFANASGYYYNPDRFVGTLTFALNYRFGGLDVTGYHAVNLAIHIAAALLVYTFVLLTFRTPQMKESTLAPRARSVALLAAALFVVHPVQTEAVTYIVQRVTSLATLFYLLALVCYARMRVGQESATDGRGKTAVLYLLSLAAIVLSMRSKEISFTLPLVVTLYEFSFFRGAAGKRLVLLVPILLTLLIIPLTLVNIQKPVGEVIADVSEVTQLQTNLSRWDYLVTQFSVIVTYLRLLILPVGQNVDYDYPVYHSLFTPRVILSFLFLCSLLALAVWLYLKSRFSVTVSDSTQNSELKTQNLSFAALRLIAFGIFWFFITLAVESSVVPIVDVIFEHRVYLPSVGAFIAFSAALVFVADRAWGAASLRAAGVGAAIAIVALACVTWQRNLVWRDPETLWQDALSKSPGKGRVYYNLGTVLSAQGRTDEAIECFLTAIRLRPTSEEYNNLGSAYQTKGLFDQAIEMHRRAIDMKPDNAEAYYNLGRAYLSLSERFDDAIALFSKAIKLDPRYADAYVNLAAAYIKGRRYGDAVKLLEEHRPLLESRPDMHANLGLAYYLIGDAGGAERELAILRGAAPTMAANLEKYMAQQRRGRR